MKKFTFTILTIFIVMIVNSIAQNSTQVAGTASMFASPAGALWELTDPGTGGTGLTPSTTGQVSAADELLNNMEINHYTGPDDSQRARIAGNEWPANQLTQIDSVFIEFAVSPQFGFTFHIDSLSFGMAAASISSMKANVYFSTDPTFTTSTMVAYSTGDPDNYLRTDSLTLVSDNPDIMLDEGETFYLRIYPWVHNDPNIRTGKYVCLKNVVISGEVEGIPAAVNAQWPFQNSEDPVTTGPIVAFNPEYSDAMAFYGYTQLPRTDTTETVTVGAIQTVSQSWIAAPDPVDSLWFQFSIEPKFGGTLYTDSVSLYIGGWFSNDFRAAFYYSKDSTFTDSTLIIADTSLVGNAIMPLRANLTDTVNTGEKLYIRVYPHHTVDVGWAKLIAIYDVNIYGTVTGVTADPPTLSTANVSSISTTFVVCGGTISTDGGSPVTERGVAWNTTGAPTIADSTTSDGSGTGSFVSVATGLTPGTTYYMRAYATNGAGTSYGEERTFNTLDSLSVPGVITVATVNNILAKTADCYGQVTDWGGDTVIVRGFCWNTTGNPTLADSYSENGSGLGDFTGTLYPLVPSTQYYVRAYATNSIGTGYGSDVTFTTQAQAPDVVRIVDADGGGDYTTIQAAFDDVPDFYTGTWTIFVQPGTYYEKMFLHRDKVNVVLMGVHPDSCILVYDDYAGIAGGTSNSYSVAIEPNDFTAVNITFQNTVVNDGSVSDQQAVALRVNGDRQAYYNCKLLGYQDTFYVWGGRGTGRVYLKNCYVEGSVDFIFGRDIVLFDSCEIHINRNGGSLTAASTEADSKFGLVFSNCTLSADSIGFNGTLITSFILGRPWQAAPRTVYLNCYEPASVHPGGWQTWNVTPALYAEYQCFGPGADTTSRISIGQQLTSTQAAEYTIANIFAKSSNPAFSYDWFPPGIPTGIDDDEYGKLLVPDNYKLHQNFPNPFNPNTTIRFQLPKNGKVKLIIYNTLGQVVKTLLNENFTAGYHHVVFDASSFASGVYFYRIDANEYCEVKKMILMK